MMVCSKFGDNVTVVTLVVGIVLCFVCCLGIYSYEFFVSQEFWRESAKCLVERDFDCLLNISAAQSINKDMILTLIGVNASIIGVIFGFLIVSLYSLKRINRPKPAV